MAVAMALEEQGRRVNKRNHNLRQNQGKNRAGKNCSLIFITQDYYCHNYNAKNIEGRIFSLILLLKLTLKSLKV
ncbi:hypothetical protein RchiOBHm_Chr6g0279341 [Rosa chinensis]|uniref:Uncharacterized protein n=1 Tax=Rosa chinensis TaxID=74649 RepID=A0A2P6PT03_ROSCH|nr:hypothetical protein RchiOBHm_Chr6g0279341 [Rosa chinensis]